MSDVWELTTSRTQLGWIGVLSAGKGVRHIEMGKSQDGVLASLRARFPKAEFAEPTEEARAWGQRIAEYCDGGAEQWDVPLDVRGTAFQQDVWNALRAIPEGETRSYAEIARAIGRPKSARAVGAACGANPFAPLIPCHRVLRGDGGIGGYGYGLEIKRRLLAREGVEAP